MATNNDDGPYLRQTSNHIDVHDACTSINHEKNVLLSEDISSGLRIAGVITRGSDNVPHYDLLITNLTQHPLAGLQFQFNKNSFMLTPIQQPNVGMVSPGESRKCCIPLSYSGATLPGKISSVLQVAVKSPLQNDAVFYFSDQIPLEAIALPDSRMEFDQFVRCWHSPPSTYERIERFVASPEMLDPDHATVRLEQNKISLVSHKAVSGMKGRAACFSGKVNGADQVEWFLLQIDFSIGTEIILRCRRHTQSQNNGRRRAAAGDVRRPLEEVEAMVNQKLSHARVPLRHRPGALVAVARPRAGFPEER